MITRRDLVADAAIAVISLGGMRGLSHRTIDRFAQLPEGSTSNYFGPRAELVEGVSARVLFHVSTASQLAIAAEFTGSQYRDDLLHQHRYLMRALTILATDPSLSSEASENITTALAEIVSTISRLSYVKVDEAMAVVGRMFFTAGIGIPAIKNAIENHETSENPRLR